MAIIVLLIIIGFALLKQGASWLISGNSNLAFLAGGTGILFLAMYTGRKRTIDRWEAFVLMAAYLTYVVAILL